MIDLSLVIILPSQVGPRVTKCQCRTAFVVADKELSTEGSPDYSWKTACSSLTRLSIGVYAAEDFAPLRRAWIKRVGANRGGVTMSRTPLITVLSMVSLVAGCTAENVFAPAAFSAAPVAPAIIVNPPVAADDRRLQEKLDKAQTAAIACVLAQANRLATQPENPDHIALAAMAGCDRQERQLRKAAELRYGRERTRNYMLMIEEEMRKGVVALVVTLRSKARQQEPTKPTTRRETHVSG